MTATRPSVEHNWERTQLWLDDLYGDSGNPGETPESVGAEPDADAQPHSAGPPDTASAEPAPLPPATAEPAASPSAASPDGPDGAVHGPNAAAVDDDTADEYGPWWLQEPPSDEGDYTDLDPIDLDEPLSARPPRTKPSRRNGHSVPAAAASPILNDPGEVFDAAEDHAWMADTAATSAAAIPTPPPGTGPAPVLAVDAAARPAPRFNKALALSFVAATVVGTIAVTSVLLGMRRESTADDGMGEDTSTQISVVAAPAPSATVDPEGDAPIPYVASADCPAGSTPAQSVAGDDPSRAWVCVRGGVDGQVLTLDLGRTMLVTALSITPGWVGTDAAGHDQWLAHRVVTRVQWVFDGDPSTVMTQMTGNVRGEAVQAVPGRGVLASKITMIVLQTSRPPADVTPTPTPGASGSFFDPAMPAPGAPAPAAPIETFSLPALPGSTSSTDPVDTTFAVSSIKVLGHPPA